MFKFDLTNKTNDHEIKKQKSIIIEQELIITELKTEIYDLKVKNGLLKEEHYTITRHKEEEINSNLVIITEMKKENMRLKNESLFIYKIFIYKILNAIMMLFDMIYKFINYFYE
jgi:hypothetical protein